MTAALEIENLTVAYGNVVAVRGVSFVVPERQVVALLGANGAGKTSLLGGVSGLIRASSGRVRVGGVDISGLPAQKVARRGLRLVPESRALFPDLTVLENLHVGAGRLHRAERDRRVERAFDLFPVLGRRSRQAAGTMSGGEQQMLSIARSLAADPRVLVLDEPSMGLAPMVVASIVETIARLRDEGLTVLVAEQNARAVLPVADRAVLMARGQVLREGPAAEVREQVEAEGYLGGATL
ncbi:ABC transporter ATP-binding protein [Asanoa sp. NPDC050611]|uniref:ABC transporter ATP-binding protein n=1 Tax=Asanoa sp. NPDC050611 TaxID=3157098 RepID=UPI0033E9AC36